MGAQKIFVSCLITLVLFNILFYLTGYNVSMMDTGTIISMFVTAGLLAATIAMIPTTSGGGTLTWFISTLMMLALLYAIDVPIFTYTLRIGVGLVSNLTGMFSGDVNSLSFLPFMFFNAIGLIGILSGVMMMNSGD